MALILNGSDTSAGNDAGLGYTSAEGIIITGQGTTSDVTIKNDADETVLSIPTGTTNVGIGTTSPSVALDVVGSARASQSLTIGTNGTYEAGSIYSDSNWGMIFRAKQSSPASADFRWANSADTERMRIAADGNVGIGETSPAAQLHVKNSGGNSVSIVGQYGTGTRAEISAFANQVELRAYNGTNDVMTFKTGSTERMRINSDGRIGVAVDGISGVQFGMKINGQDWFFVCDADDGTDKFRVASSGNVQNANNSYGSTSDIKLKENIVDASNKLEELKQVRIRNFNFKGDSQKQIGVIAQELETIFPSMVEEHPDLDEDGEDLGTVTKSVKYSVFVPMLIKAMQEQQTVIEALETRITALEAG